MRRPVLFYAVGCPKCRVLSRLIVFATGGVLRRAPVDGPEAQAWYNRHPERRGKLMLVRGDDSVVLGRWVYAAMPAVLARAWLALAGWAAADIGGLLRPGRRHRPARVDGGRADAARLDAARLDAARLDAARMDVAE